MANEAIERTVDDLIQKGRISRDLRDEYIRDMEMNLQNDLLRGADYTNKTKALAAERQQAEQRLQQEYQKLQADRQKLEQWQGQVQGELSKLDALPEMSAKLAAYEQVLKDYQIDGGPLINQVQIPQVPKTPNPGTQMQQPRQTDRQQPDGEYMTIKTAGAALRDFALLQSKVSRISAQHAQLFGTPLEDDLVGHYLDTGEDPEQHWKVKYGVEAKRQEMQAATDAAKEARLREQIRAELQREYTVDPSRVTGSPLGRPQGGLTPLLEAYASSRALENSKNTLGGTTPPPQPDAFIPPEKKPELAASRERVAAASRMFAEHFDLTGNPISDRGRQLVQTYKD